MPHRLKGLVRQRPRVGLIDSGLDRDHPWFNALPLTTRYLSQTGEPIHEQAVDWPGVHGTHTAGIVCYGDTAAASQNCLAVGELMVVAAIPHGDVIVRLLLGLQWLWEQQVRLICLPFGLPQPNPVLDPMLQALRARNILTIAAVGNGGAGRARSPATAAGVLAVGAVDERGGVPDFSGSLNPNGHYSCLKPDLMAPGVNILSAVPEGGLARRSGTSMAAAYAAHVAARLLTACPDATANELAAALILTARPLPEDQAYRCAGGIIQPQAAHRLIRAARRRTLPLPTPPYAECFRDPRLLRQLRVQDEQRPHAAVIVAREDVAAIDERGAAGPLVDHVAHTIGETPDRVRYLPLGRLAIVWGSACLIRAFMEVETVQTLSAVDVDRWQF